MRNPGRIFRVTEGARKGLWAIAYNREQLPEVATAGKILCHFYMDAELEIRPNAFAHKGLIDPGRLEQIGFTD